MRSTAKWGIKSNAEAIAEERDPLAALSLADDLRAALDEFERACVRQARADGDTWDEIAGAMRVTKQAAHKRFAGFPDIT